MENGGKQLLAPRYRHSGRAHIALNEVQQRSKRQVEEKIEAGRYGFEEIACPICRGEAFDLLSEQDRYGLYMPVQICRTCGLLLTSPRMTQASYNEFYNSEYRPLYEGHEKPTQAAFQIQVKRGQRIINYVQRFLARPPQDLLVLEVGCGAGGVLSVFKQHGYRTKGIDLGEEHLAYGVAQHGLDLTACTLAELELERAPDLIIYSHVMEHILDLPGELAQLQRTLAPDGFLFVEVPGVKLVQLTYQGDFMRMLQNAHTFHFTLTSLTNLMQAHGFYRLAGDEMIQSLFARAPEAGHDGGAIESDHDAVRRFLAAVEGEYQLAEGIGLLKSRRYVDAAVRLAELTELRPSDPVAYRLFADALQHLGKTEEARRIRQAVAAM